jgi:hypothetical protein
MYFFLFLFTTKTIHLFGFLKIGRCIYYKSYFPNVDPFSCFCNLEARSSHICSSFVHAPLLCFHRPLLHLILSLYTACAPHMAPWQAWIVHAATPFLVPIVVMLFANCLQFIALSCLFYRCKFQAYCYCTPIMFVLSSHDCFVASDF